MKKFVEFITNHTAFIIFFTTCFITSLLTCSLYATEIYLFETKWGSSGSGITVDSFGNNVYVADTENNRIQKFALSVQALTTGSISGKVTKSEGTTGISQAVVEAIQSGVVKSSVTTSTDGTYQLINLSTGTYWVFISSIGYIAKLNKNVSVTTGQTTTLNVSLGTGDPNLVGYWKFDEGEGNIAFDYSGYVNYGIIYGATWSTSSAVASGAGGLSFDGVDDYVDIGKRPAFDTKTTTVIMRLKCDSLPSSGKYMSIVGNGDYESGNDLYYIMLTDSGKLRVECNYNGGWSTFDSNASLVAGQWNHVSLVVSDSQKKVYLFIDGVNDSYASFTASQPSAYNRLSLGRWWDGWFFIMEYIGGHVPFKGIIDEARIYKRALTQAEIQADMTLVQQTGIISGKVTKSDGSTPLTTALVEAMQGGSLINQATTDSSGNYSLVLSTGTYDVRFSKLYYSTKTVYNVYVGTGTTTLNVSLEETHGYISGTVTKKADGVTPISGAKVEAMRTESLINQATTNANGNYSLYIPTGTYDLVFSANNYSSLSVSNVRVYSSSTTTVNVSLSSIFGTVYGVVKDSSTSNPINGVTVSISSGGVVKTFAITDANGSYSINYGSGTYEIKASKKGYLSERKTNYDILVDSQIAANFYLIPFNPPQVNSTSHPLENIWYANANPIFNWNAVTGAVSYYYLLDKTSDTPVSSLNGVVIISTNVSFTSINEGIWYFHLVAVDSEDNLSAQTNYTVRIDTTPPSAPSLNSSTHPDSNLAYLSKSINISITAPSDTSGIAGYYYVFDSSAGTIPTTQDSYLSGQNYWTTTVTEDGTYYFHCIAKDNAGNPGTTVATREIKIKTIVYPNQDNTFSLADGTKVEISSGTLDKENKIEITTPTVSELVNKGRVRADIFDEKIKGSEIIREITLATSTTLSKEVTIEIPYTAEEITGLTENELKIVYWSASTGKGLWEIIPSEVVRSTTQGQGKVKGTVKHLGIFRVVEYISSEETVSGISNYPNPFVAKREKTKIRYHLKENSDVEIRIYDLIGDLVWEKKISAGESPGGIAGPNEIEWDGRNENGEYVTAGGYICLVKVGNKTLKRKIGVK